MNYVCPLCGQPVSLTQYRKITGIWKERQKLLKKVNEERAKLKQRLAKEKKRLQRERAKFNKQKAEFIRKAVGKRTKRFEKQIAILKRKEERIRKKSRRELAALKRKEKQIEQRARDEIRMATKQATARADKLAKERFNSLKRQLRDSIKSQVKQARERRELQVKKKYEKLEKSFKSTLRSMETRNKQIWEQKRQIEELKKQLERRTTPQIEGFLYESNLARELKKRFREDKIRHTGKGGDVIQYVMQKGEQVGVIVYECKRVKHYQSKHVKQAAEAKKKRNADFAVLVTSAMKRNTQGFFVERGVIVVHPAGVQSIADIIRGQIVQIEGMKLGQLQKDRAVKLILEYLEGAEFANSMDAIIQESITAYDELKDEVKKHIARWKKRYLSYKTIHGEAATVKGKSKALMSGEPVPAQKIFLPEPAELKVPVAVPVRKKKKRLGIAIVTAGDDSVKEV